MKLFRRKRAAPETNGAAQALVSEPEIVEMPPDVLAADTFEETGQPEHDSSDRFRTLSMESHGSLARPRVVESEPYPQPLEAPEAPAASNAPPRRRIWEMEAQPDFGSPRAGAEVVAEQPSPTIEPDDVALARARIAQFSQAGLTPAEVVSNGGRAKTRLLGFQSADLAQKDPFSAKATPAADAIARFPVGWLVVIAGPGRGACFTLTNGVSSIGRGEDQSVCLDFGDGSISRNNHAAVAYDDETNCFFLGQGGKSNIVRLNDRPVLSTVDLSHGDRIRIGETSLQFVAFCGEAFSWTDAQGGAEDKNAVC